MTQPLKNTFLVVAIVTAVLSIPLDWVTTGQILTGLRGDLKLTEQVRIPFWLLMAITAAASAFQLMATSRFFSVPIFLQWLAATVSLLLIGMAGTTAISERVSIGLGGWLAVFAALIPVFCLIIPTVAEPLVADVADTVVADVSNRR